MFDTIKLARSLEAIAERSVSELSPAQSCAEADAPSPTRNLRSLPEIQEIVHTAFCASLKTDKVGLDDSFFELGGHSLQAVDTLAAINAALGVEIDLDVMFTDDLTVRSLSALIVSKKDTESPDIRQVE